MLSFAVSALLAAASDLGLTALVEVHDHEEMASAIHAGAKLIGINNRNLRDFHVDLAVTEELAHMVTPEHILVAESGIFTPFDVRRLSRTGATAMLVGESLMKQGDVTAATKNLLSLA